jgi:DNA primase
VGNWVGTLSEELPSGPLRTLVSELAVERLMSVSTDEVAYAGAVLASLGVRAQLAHEAELEGALRRAEAVGDNLRTRELLGELQEVSDYRRKLSERAAEGGL